MYFSIAYFAGQVQNVLPAQQSLGERGLTEAAGR